MFNEMAQLSVYIFVLMHIDTYTYTHAGFEFDKFLSTTKMFLVLLIVKIIGCSIVTI